MSGTHTLALNRPPCEQRPHSRQPSCAAGGPDYQQCMKWDMPCEFLLPADARRCAQPRPCLASINHTRTRHMHACTQHMRMPHCKACSECAGCFLGLPLSHCKACTEYVHRVSTHNVVDARPSGDSPWAVESMLASVRGTPSRPFETGTSALFIYLFIFKHAGCFPRIIGYTAVLFIVNSGFTPHYQGLLKITPPPL